MKAPREEIYGKSTQETQRWKYIQWVSTLSLTIRVFRLAELLPPKSAISHEILRKISSSRSSKAIDRGVNRKRICNFLLVININFGCISYSFRDIEAFKIACFPAPHHCLTPPSGWAPLDIDIIYTPLKSAFNGLQFRRWHYRSIFIRLAVVASRNREITRNSDKIWPYSSSRSSKQRATAYKLYAVAR